MCDDLLIIYGIEKWNFNISFKIHYGIQFVDIQIYLYHIHIRKLFQCNIFYWICKQINQYVTLCHDQPFQHSLQTSFNNDKYITWHQVYYRLHFYFHKINKLISSIITMVNSPLLPFILFFLCFILSNVYNKYNSYYLHK